MSANESSKKMQRALCIDDDDDYNFLTQEAFSDCDFKCEITFKTDVLEALAYLDSLDLFPDVIFLDINMPIINGWEFLAEYEARNYHKSHNTLIFMHSSSVYEEDKIKAKKFEKVIDFIDKPLDFEKIQQIRNAYFPNTASERKI